MNVRVVRVVRRALERLPAKLRSFVTGVVALAVVVTTLLAGHTYFYCAPMQRVAFDECCAQHEDEGTRDEAPSVDETHRCCEAKTFARGDASRGGVASPVILATPLVTVLPAVPEAAFRAARVAVRPRLPEPRAGPPPSSPLAHRVPVDVSLS